MSNKKMTPNINNGADTLLTSTNDNLDTPFTAKNAHLLAL